MHIAPILKEQITQYLPVRPVIVEAGAHIGRDTLRMSALWPQAQIHAFEPVSSLYEQLLARTADLQNVVCYNLALSDHTGTERLYVSSGASTAVSSLLEPYEYLKERPHVQFETQMVPTTTLDQWADDYGIERVDFLWLDMQGAEKKVLDASPKIVETVGCLVLEASLTERFKGTPLFHVLKPWIEKKGFTVVQRDEPKHNKVNMLCVRPTII